VTVGGVPIDPAQITVDTYILGASTDHISSWQDCYRTIADCTALAGAAISAFGWVDVLVNNAGVGTAVPALKETPEQFRSVVDLNLNAS
jgi:NAD(P)-dependent dehydrogenase (short-subunit alcohol dehydrogenase family)